MRRRRLWPGVSGCYDRRARARFPLSSEVCVCVWGVLIGSADAGAAAGFDVDPPMEAWVRRSCSLVRRCAATPRPLGRGGGAESALVERNETVLRRAQCSAGVGVGSSGWEPFTRELVAGAWRGPCASLDECPFPSVRLLQRSLLKKMHCGSLRSQYARFILAWPFGRLRSPPRRALANRVLSTCWLLFCAAPRSCRTTL